ncbi:MAG: tetratricopeptide repeat protein [Nocardioidaceae bacterium]
MAEERRGQRPGKPDGRRTPRTGGKPDGRGGKPAARSGKPDSRSGKPDSRSGKPDSRGGKPDARSGKPDSRGGKPESLGGKPDSRGGKPDSRGSKPAARGGKSEGWGARSDSRDGKPATRGTRGGQGRSQRKGDWSRPADKQVERSVDQKTYDGPPLSEEVTGRELDRSIAAQLKGLPEKLAARVARHLVAAGQLIDDEPEVAYQHTLAAKARAARLAVVREAVGEAAYAAGHYSEALAELRAAKRMNGATAYLPIMADCLRALGRPDEALKMARNPSVVGFEPAAKAEMTLVEAGARRDLGDLDAALLTLERAPLTSRSRESWVIRLRYAYADTLAAAGRERDALAWFHRTHAIDSDEITDAADRADELERRVD